jgi:hypothetical protein
VINRIKALVLGLFAVYWVIVVVILVAAREVFDQVGGLPGNQRPAEIGALLGLTAPFGLLSTGVIRNWRLDLLADPGRLHGRHLAGAHCQPTAREIVPRSRPRLVGVAPGDRWPDPVGLSLV